MSWFYLGLAIVAEVIATTALKATASFSKLWPSVITMVGYAVAFYFLSLTLRHIPVGIAYAVWSGVGIVAISLIGWLWFAQRLNGAALLGIALIVIGVLILNIFGKSTG